MIRTTTSVKQYAATAFIMVVASLATAAALAQGLPAPTASARAALKQLSSDDAMDQAPLSTIGGIYETPDSRHWVLGDAHLHYLFNDGTYVTTRWFHYWGCTVRTGAGAWTLKDGSLWLRREDVGMRRVTI